MAVVGAQRARVEKGHVGPHRAAHHIGDQVAKVGLARADRREAAVELGERDGDLLLELLAEGARVLRDDPRDARVLGQVARALDVLDALEPLSSL